MSDWNDFLVNAQRSLFTQAHTHGLFIERIMLEIPKGGSILEAGCGLAYLSRLLDDYGYKVTAGDIDEDVLASAQHGFRSAISPLKFMKLDLFNLSSYFPPNSFDAIMHSGVMEHFSDENIENSFCQQRSVAKSLIFKVPNNRTRMGKGHFGDERFLSNDRWVGLLKNAGYSDVRVYGGESAPIWTQLFPSIFHAYPKNSRSDKINLLLSTLSFWRRYLSRHSIFVCK